MKNKECLYLCHMTKEEKKEYNKRYYQEHKEEYWGVKSGADRFKDELQRPRSYTSVKTGQTYTFGGGRYERDDGSKTPYKGMSELVDDLKKAGLDIQSASVHKRERIGRVPTYFMSDSRRNATPDINARTSAIQKAQQQSARLSTPDLSQRLANMKAYAQPLRKTGLSSIASSAVSKGKSIVQGFASLWKLGWK